MTVLIRSIIIMLSGFILPGCLVVQLNGHVGDAAVTVSPLSDEADIFQVTRSQSPKSIASSNFAELYDQLPASAQLLWLGTVAVPGTWNPEQLYIATAAGGLDFDSDRDLAIDSAPRPVQGRWRAIVPGSAFALKTTKVSALTEATYQWLRASSDTPLAERNATEILEDLDRAAQMTLDDVNGDGTVNYSDMLMWHPTIHADAFRGDARHIDLMVTTISLGLDERLKQWAGTQLITGRGQRPPATDSLLNYAL